MQLCKFLSLFKIKPTSRNSPTQKNNIDVLIYLPVCLNSILFEHKVSKMYYQWPLVHWVRCNPPLYTVFMCWFTYNNIIHIHEPPNIKNTSLNFPSFLCKHISHWRSGPQEQPGNQNICSECPKQHSSLIQSWYSVLPFNILFLTYSSVCE